MFNKFFPNLCVKVNKLWAKLAKNDEVKDFMEEGSVKANPTLAGTEALITGIEVDGTKYKNVIVEANPTLAGTESELTGIEIDNTKYKLTKTKYYSHNVKLIYSTTGTTPSKAYLLCSFVSTQNSAYTVAQFLSYVRSKGFKVASGNFPTLANMKAIPCNGYGVKGTLAGNVVGFVVSAVSSVTGNYTFHFIIDKSTGDSIDSSNIYGTQLSTSDLSIEDVCYEIT